MNNIHLWKRVLLAIGTVTLTSCFPDIEHDRYPKWWENPQPKYDNVCADISGTYNDYGQGVADGTDNVGSLGLHFWPTSDWNTPFWAKYRKVSKRVVIKQHSNVMKVSIWTMSPNELIAERVVNKEENNGYRCATQGIVLDRLGEPYKGFYGYANRTITLFKDAEGAIILKVELTGIGVAYILPVYISRTRWRRYSPLSIAVGN